jgi:hypothetical protein
LDALHAVGVFEVEALKAFRDYWQEFPFTDAGIDSRPDAIDTIVNWTKLTDLDFGMLKRLDQQDLLSPAATVEHQNTIIRELLFPLYPFDLGITRNFRDLPPPDSPYSY